jgi:ankyrin repeat protein
MTKRKKEAGKAIETEIDPIEKKPKISNLVRFEQVMANKATSILDEANLRLFASVMMGTEEDVTKAIAEGANVNALNLNQLSPFDLAKAFKRKEIMKILEENGAQAVHRTVPKKKRTK